MAVVPALRLAHRGDHRVHLENSFAAILGAMDVPGCDGVEFDVRSSADGVPVLLHDETLERTHGRPEAVGALTATELDGLGVARLDAVLAALPRRAFLDIELKESFGRPLIEVLAAGRGPELRDAVISAFDPAILARIEALVPGWPRWLNARSLTRATIARAVDGGCAGVSIEWTALTPTNVRTARRAGLQVTGWTVTKRSTYTRLVELGVGAICVEGDALTS
jgi:glycerophosphoryl diester phosphodiesterase